MVTRKRRRTKRRKSRRRRRAFRKLRCAPKDKRNKDVLGFTCYTATALHKLRDGWNARHPDRRIDTNDPRRIWEGLKYVMSTTCATEACWIRHQCMKNDLDHGALLGHFAPEAPAEWKDKPSEWLTTVDIQEVMRQWEKAHPRFAFLGPSPSDYGKRKLFDECVWEELCKFSLANYRRKGKTKIGVIFNLDPHYKPGSHWVALFIDIKKQAIYYFDSYAEGAPAAIMKFVHEVQKQGKRNGTPFTFEQNKKRHQYSDSECGMYSMFFILRMLHGKTFESFQRYRVPDKAMRRLRKIYFNHDLNKG